MKDQKIYNTVRHIVSLLVKKEYGAIESITKGIRLSKEDLSFAISEYGRTLRMSPDDAVEIMSIPSIHESEPQTWAVCVDLWTEEEGRSDLSLELTLRDSDSDFLDVEVDDLHVL